MTQFYETGNRDSGNYYKMSYFAQIISTGSYLHSGPSAGEPRYFPIHHYLSLSIGIAHCKVIWKYPERLVCLVTI